MYQQLIDDFIQQEKLPASYSADASLCFLPLFADIMAAIETRQTRPFALGINGAQGTGKSTLASLLSRLLDQAGYRVANLSIDDFYYSKQQRQDLATTVHPLLRSRGVPGTHDVELALRVMEDLANAGEDQVITLPGFDKSTDDCKPDADCQRVQGPIDVVILEGWFVGAAAQRDDELVDAVNKLESSEDADGRWRRYVNDALGGAYQALFGQLDMLVLLAAPGFEQVLEWRSLQEAKLRSHSAANAAGLMDEEAIERFIQHFERLTRHCLHTLPTAADRVFRLDAGHRVHPA